MLLISVFIIVFVTVYIIYNQLHRSEEKATGELLKDLIPPQGEEEKHSDVINPPRFITRPVIRSFSKRLEKFNFFKDLNDRLLRTNLAVSAVEFIILKVVSTFIGLVIGNIFFAKNTIVILIIMAVSFLLPDFWLKGKIDKRKRLINRDLPIFINILGLCVSAGSDFMLSLQKIVKEFKTDSPLAYELKVVLRQIQIGKSREEALKNFAWRVDMQEVYSFVRILLQAERMGTPISVVLESLAGQVRSERFYRGEAQALKAPLKLLIPLIFFILPVVFIIIGGPILIQFSRTGSGLSGF